jgi:NAD(P)-dependent dehydrogenase (short-subunit alcohol dehydrogenase family)
MELLQGKTALITGGGSGIGFAIARALVAEGANVVVVSRRADVLADAAAQLNSIGKGKAIHAVCDLRKQEDVARAVQTANAAFPSIDILVNNSGLGGPSKIVDCSDEEWNRVLDTNLNGAFRMTRAVLPGMIARHSGSIINIASQAAKHGYANAGPYCASKFGLVGFAEALQEEVREYGIIVHSLCPALVQVPPPGKQEDMDHGVLQVEDLASTVLFLLTQPRRIKFENIGLYHI